MSQEFAAILEAYHERKRLEKAPPTRFWAKVRKAEGEGCWEWTGYIHKTGYGYFTSGGKSWRAPRFSWVMAHGPIPDGKHVLHSCDNRKCIRPEHLRLGTPKENASDMMARGRNAVGVSVLKLQADLAAANEAIRTLRRDLAIERMRLRQWKHGPRGKASSPGS